MSTAPTPEPTPTPAPVPQPAPASPTALGSATPESPRTLHDVVVNLLSDADLRSAFALDPEGTLESLGLSDVVPADVHDVIPLVVDSVPLPGLTDPGTVGNPGSLGAAPAGAVGQLQAVAHQATAGVYGTGADVTVADIGTVSVDPSGLTVSAASALPGFGLGGGVAVDLSGADDLAETLDAGVLEPAGGRGVLDGVLGAADVAATTLTSTAGTATNLLGAGDLGGLTDLTGALDNATDLSSTLGTAITTVDGTLAGIDDVDSTLGGVTDTVGGVTGLDSALGGVTGTVGGVTDLGGTWGTVTGTVGGALSGVTGLVDSGDLGVPGLTDGVL